MSNIRKVPLDELEVMIQLVQITDSKFKSVSYKQLAEEINRVFNVEVEETDINLLYEPTLQNDIYDSEIFYANILNYSPVINDYEQQQGKEV